MVNGGPTRVGVIRAVQFAAAMAIVLWPVSGWAQSDSQVTFTSTTEQTVDARSSPAKVTDEEASALISKGYVKIGTIHGSKEVKKKEAKNADPDITKQLESAILQKAAEAGGDVVLFSERGELGAITVENEGKCLRVDEGGPTVVGPTISNNGSVQIAPHPARTCVVYAGRTAQGVVSEGTVWRNTRRVDEGARVNAVAADIMRSRYNLTTGIEESVNADPGLVSTRDSYGMTLLHWAAQGSYSKDLAEFLLAKGSDVNAKGPQGAIPLHLAAQYGRRDVAALLLAKGSDVDARDLNGSTPLHIAAAGDNTDVAELLLANGADVNSRDSKGETPLRVARIHHRKAVADLLRHHGGHE